MPIESPERQHPKRTSRDAPTGHKLFNFSSIPFQSRRWAHIKRAKNMIHKIARYFEFGRRSLVKDIIIKLKDDDPNFGKVQNDNSNEGFAFELQGSPSIREMSKSLNAANVLAMDDYGKSVTHVPLGSTSRSFFFDLLNYSIELRTDEKSIPVPELLYGLSSGIINCLDQSDLPKRRKKKLESVRMSRFYHNPRDPWWTFTHE